ncbi:hypothetical protein [Streptomyces sp. NPDC005262]|uniref:hypothetical protein n=1 Tax=Streptomyces sp. NPDC005262 TaxID=3364710 RepID=UPI0036ABA961
MRKLLDLLGLGNSEDLAAFVKTHKTQQDAQLTEAQRREKAADDALSRRCRP